MKLTIITNQKIKDVDLTEVKDFTGFQVVVIPTTETIKPKFHADNQQWYGDFDWIRSLFTEPTDARCFLTTQRDLEAKGITQNLAAYDNADKDTVYDFYIGLEKYLDDRARTNGFKCNLAWEICHEMCHGAEQFQGNVDRTHGMEAQGKLKDLWRELFVTNPALKQQITGLQAMVFKLLAMFQQKKTPFFDKPYPITQAFGVYNPIYKQTKHHLGTDYATPLSTIVYAPLDGTLTQNIGIETGLVATLETKQGTYQFLHLGHCAPIGTYKQGNPIGYTGNSGTMSTGAHCCVRLWKSKPDISVLTTTNFTNYLTDVTK